mmetsp:Transcript_137471/g.239004  ORF Transcript_137471/g.239004 Transcript_137471/m.239004 type:complete len:340 (-) Transcript_137471:2521-3540(-)
MMRSSSNSNVSSWLQVSACDLHGDGMGGVAVAFGPLPNATCSAATSCMAASQNSSSSCPSALSACEACCELFCTPGVAALDLSAASSSSRASSSPSRESNIMSSCMLGAAALLGVGASAIDSSLCAASASCSPSSISASRSHWRLAGSSSPSTWLDGLPGERREGEAGASDLSAARSLLALLAALAGGTPNGSKRPSSSSNMASSSISRSTSPGAAELEASALGCAGPDVVAVDMSVMPAPTVAVSCCGNESQALSKSRSKSISRSSMPACDGKSGISRSDASGARPGVNTASSSFGFLAGGSPASAKVSSAGGNLGPFAPNSAPRPGSLPRMARRPSS